MLDQKHHILTTDVVLEHTDTAAPNGGHTPSRDDERLANLVD